MTDEIAYLRRALDQGLLVPFVGAGLAAASADLPSWNELLERGLRYAVDQLGAPIADPRIDRAHQLAANSDLPAAFDFMRELLDEPSGRATTLGYEAFLADTFADPHIVSATLLEALHFLQPRRIVTTNYDTLLEDYDLCGGHGVTWKQPSEIREIFRLGEGVVHLHGRWDRPESVILTAKSYEQISGDSQVRQIAQAIFHAGVLLFLGTSLDGTHDPHLSELLNEFEALADPAAGVKSPHVILVRGRVDGSQRARWNRQGIRAVSYGESHDDLPDFLRKIGSSGQVRISTRPVDQLLAEVGRAATIDDALRAVGNWISSEVFGRRSVRVTFSEKVAAGNGFLLRQRAVIPSNSSGNPHNYPLSIAAWALLEGRMISWPRDRSEAVDVGWLTRLRKLDRVTAQIMSSDMDESPELRRYVDLERVRSRFRDGTLRLDDFFQDWASDQRALPYQQFLSVPVPMMDAASNRQDPPEYGVFNIDSLERSPLRDRRVEELLKIASVVTGLAYRLFKEQSADVPTTRQSKSSKEGTSESVSDSKPRRWRMARRLRS